MMTFEAQFDAQGQVVGALGAGQDIHELESLRYTNDATQHELANLLETANAPVFGTDNDGRVNQWNRKMVAMTGHANQAMLGNTLMGSPAIGDNRERLRHALERASVSYTHLRARET